MTFSEILTVPTCVTKAASLLGKLTKVFTVAITVVKHDKECTMWYVAPVSITQFELLKAFLSTILVEKTECFKLGRKGILKFIPDMKATLVLRLGEAEVPTTSNAIPVSPSTPVYMQEELTLAACEASPKPALELVLPELRKARSCSHCVLEIGH